MRTTPDDGKCLNELPIKTNETLLPKQCQTTSPWISQRDIHLKRNSLLWHAIISGTVHAFFFGSYLLTMETLHYPPCFFIDECLILRNIAAWSRFNTRPSLQGVRPSLLPSMLFDKHIFLKLQPINNFILDCLIYQLTVFLTRNISINPDKCIKLSHDNCLER